VKAAPSGPPAGFGGSFRPGAAIVCATLLAYVPTLTGDFVWNDSDYVTAPALRSLSGLGRIWTEPGATEQYYPLLHTAFWVQHRLWGDHPLGYHLVTLLLHAGSAVLYALVLRRLFAGSGMRSPARAAWLAALLFALHPVHVESVAWIAEQKNTLSLAFYLGAALLYLAFDETRRPRLYLAALALFGLSLGCKTVTATLPAALLVVLWWQRGRLELRRDVRPLVPWLVLGAGAGLFSSWIERSYGGAQGAEFTLPWLGRVLVAGRAVWFYAGHLVWPFGLNFIYPRWTVDPSVWWQWLFPLGVLAVLAALWALRRTSRGPLAAALFFVGSLFPALGFVALYGARYSWVWDHWQYLPDLGLLALAAAGLSAGWRRQVPAPAALGWGLVTALALLLGGLTWDQGGMFRSEETLYRATLERNPDAWLAHYNLGVLLEKIPGRRTEAMAEYEATIRLKPDHAKAHYNLGLLLDDLPGRTDEAMAQYREAIRLQPGYVEAHNNLGEDYARQPGRMSRAIAEYEAAIRLRPDFAEARNNLGNAFLKTPGRLDDAIVQYEETLRLRPDLAATHYNLAIALLTKFGDSAEARRQLAAAVRLQPGNEAARRILGQLQSMGTGR
jgi:tetratricopeptide (TPR) repeat protein